MWPDWLQVAYNELRHGVKEVAGPQSNPRIVSFHSRTTLKATDDDVSWCSAFVCWCMEEAGVKHTHSARARSWLEWGVAVSPVHPPLGAVLIFARGPDPQPGPEVLDAQGHVGLFFGHAEPGSLIVLGGNQSDAVTVAKFSVHKLLGVRWAA